MIVYCFRCHEPGHIRSECPREQKVPPVAARPRGPATVYEFPAPVPPPRDEAELADHAAWAASVRSAMGWSGDAREGRARRLAREQAAEAQSHRRAESLFPG